MSKSDMTALFLHLLHEKIQVLITFRHYHVTQHLVGHNSRKQDQKRGLIIRPRSQTPRLL